MRRLFLAVACLSILTFLVTPLTHSQLITVGDISGSSTSYNLPIRAAYDYSESQYIIPATEMATAGIIDTDTLYQIGWYMVSGSFNTSSVNINVYLHEVADPYPELCTAAQANGTLVYSGPLYSVTAPGCTSVVLDTPYVYGGENLVVSVCDTVPFWNGAPSWAQNSDTGNGIYTYQDNTSFDCDMLTDTHICTDTWATTCFDITGNPTPTPTESPVPTVTPTLTPAPLGSECSNPIVIDQSALPYIETNSTCGMGFNYVTTCLGGYDGGEDIMYRLDLATDTGITLTLDPGTTAWTGMVIDDVCPPGYDNCIATYTNTAASIYGSDCLDLTAGTYYIMIDTYPSPYCIPTFNLTVEECVFQTPTPTGTPTMTPTVTPTSPPPVGDTCIDAISIACGDCVTGSTVGANNDHDCGTGHPGGDVVYELVVTDDANITFIGEADYDADWTIATTCDATTGDILCVDYTGTATDPSCSSLSHAYGGYINHTEFLTTGTYYIWVDGYFASSVGNYALEILCDNNPTPTPAPGDTCGNPIAINPGDSVIGTLIGMTDTGGQGGADSYYELVLPEDYTDVTICMSTGATWGFDPYLYLLADDCTTVIDADDDTECTGITCNGEPADTNDASLSLPVLAAGTYLIRCDCWASSTPNQFCLDISGTAGPAPTATPTGPTPTPEPQQIPSTGPAGIGLMLLAISALLSVTGIAKRR